MYLMLDPLEKQEEGLHLNKTKSFKLSKAKMISSHLKDKEDVKN